MNWDKSSGQNNAMQLLYFFIGKMTVPNGPRFLEVEFA